MRGTRRSGEEGKGRSKKREKKIKRGKKKFKLQSIDPLVQQVHRETKHGPVNHQLNSSNYVLNTLIVYLKELIKYQQII